MARWLSSIHVQAFRRFWSVLKNRFVLKQRILGDGVLDEAEYADGMSLYGFKYKECLDNFKKIAFDTNGHPIEHITPLLWKGLFMDLLFSTDKLRAGNLLFGKALFNKGNASTMEKADSLDKPCNNTSNNALKSSPQK